MKTTYDQIILSRTNDERLLHRTFVCNVYNLQIQLHFSFKILSDQLSGSHN